MGVVAFIGALNSWAPYAGRKPGCQLSDLLIRPPLARGRAGSPRCPCCTAAQRRQYRGNVHVFWYKNMGKWTEETGQTAMMPEPTNLRTRHPSTHPRRGPGLTSAMVRSLLKKPLPAVDMMDILVHCALSRYTCMGGGRAQQAPGH